MLIIGCAGSPYCSRRQYCGNRRNWWRDWQTSRFEKCSSRANHFNSPLNTLMLVNPRYLFLILNSYHRDKSTKYYIMQCTINLNQIQQSMPSWTKPRILVGGQCHISLIPYHIKSIFIRKLILLHLFRNYPYNYEGSNSWR